MQRADSPDDVYAAADFLTLHMPTTDETNGMIDAAAFAKMRDGVRILNVARGSLIVDEDLKAALDSGKVGGAALDVFRSEPITDHPLFGYPNVIVTPHLGASTAEATDRAGYQAAEQVVAALQGGSVTTAVNAPSISAEDLELLSPFLPLCRQLGRLATALAACGSIDKIEIECHGRIGERDTGPLGIAVVLGALGGPHGGLDQRRQRARRSPRSAASRSSSRASSSARDYTDLVRVAVWCGGERQNGVVGTTIGSQHRPHLLAAWGQRFNLQLEPYLTLFRYRDVPGIIGRVGTMFGEHGINIGSAAVGHTPPTAEGDRPAVMIVTTDAPVPQSLIDEIIATEDFIDGRDGRAGLRGRRGGNARRRKMARGSHAGHVDSRAGERYRLLMPAYTYVRSNDHMVTPAKFLLAIIACLLMLGPHLRDGLHPRRHAQVLLAAV